MNEQHLRQQLINYALALNSSGLSVGRSGNLSIRYQQGLLITPTGIDYQQLSAEDIVRLELDGTPGHQQRRKPSSEWHFHCSLYQTQPEVNAIVHAHPTYCTALACTGRNIPAFHYMVAVAGGKEIPIADYALFGTGQLSDNVTKTLRHHRACLLANHGMIAMGSDLERAFNLAQEVETLAQQYCEALKLGAVTILSNRQMEQVIERFKTYGQRT